jgi:hypothetical protein
MSRYCAKVKFVNNQSCATDLKEAKSAFSLHITLSAGVSWNEARN